MRTRTASLMLVLILGACGTGGEGQVPPDDTVGEDTQDTSTSIDRGEPNAEPVPTSSAPPTGEVADEVMEAVFAHLRDHLDVDSLDGVEIVRAEAVTWSDGSLGCPQPGEFYTQALVDGFHVELMFDGERFDYRIGGPQNVKLCDTQLRP